MAIIEYKIQARTSRRVASLAVWVGIAILTSCTMAAAQDKSMGQPAAVRQDNLWLKEHFLNDQAQVPISFVYDRQGSGALLKTWPKKTETNQLDSLRTKHVVVWTDPKSGLHFRVEALEFANSPVVEWTAYFKNDGKADAPILESVQALDLSFSVAARASRRFSTPRDVGSWTRMRW